MQFLIGQKNQVMHVAIIPHLDLSTEDEQELRELMTKAGLTNLKMTQNDPREDMEASARLYPGCHHMTVLPNDPPLIWRCPACRRSAPRWPDDREAPVCGCETTTEPDTMISGLPWEH